MYIPEHFRLEDEDAALVFMRANPFGILVSVSETEPFATHVPLVISKREGKILVRGHVAKQNPHWRYLERQPQSLTIFHGPHAYISPGLYATRENVPTWNYGAVHAYGTAKTFSTPEALQEMLQDLIQTFEAAYAEQWSGLSEAYRQRMLNHIVGFEIEVQRIEGKLKLSQNRSPGEQQAVIEALERSPDTAVSGVAQLMRARGLGK